MTHRRHRTTAALAIATLPIFVAGHAGAASAALVPDDLEFLNSPTIDEIVANAENGSADCAALEMVMTIGFVAAFASADFDFDMGTDTEVPAATEPAVTADAFWAISAPVIVPLLDRVDTSDPSAQALVDIIGPQLVGSIYEMRELGLTDDDLLLIQESFAEETMVGTDEMMGDSDSASAGDVPGTEDPAMANLEARAEELLSHDFKSITFMDEGGDSSLPGDDTLPWADTCPETASAFDFDMEVSATFDFEMQIEITIPVDTTA